MSAFHADSPNCSCPAYDFPHKAAMGKCTGKWWLGQYFGHDGGRLCETCAYKVPAGDHHGAYCDLTIARDPLGNCPAFAAALQTRLDQLKEKRRG